MGSRREAPRLCPACGVPVWRGSWQAALLAASILSSCFLLNQAQSGSSTEISVTWKPLEPIQGQNVTLTPGEGLENIVFCNWYRATTTDLEKRIFVYYLPPSPLGQINGAAYTGRETGSPDCSLHIRNLTSADTGNYTVTKEGAAIMIGHANIVVSESVTNIAIWGPSTTFENNITVLYCNSSGSNVSYYWLKGDQSLEVGEHISLNNNNQTLTLNTTRRNDSGDYTCYGNNSFSSGNTTHSLTVFYGPDVPVISPNTQYYGTGSNLTLSCEADSLPPAQYTWNETKAGNTFQLSNLSLDDSGNYTCKAYNNETDSAQSASLEIWVLEILSKPILTPDKNRTVENETVILQCKTSSNPKVNVSWFKDGKPVPDTAELSDMNRTLTLLNITKDDAGDYTCVASNPVSSESSNPANIVVAYGPYDVHLNQPGTLTVNLGSNLDLLCIADSFPLHFQWFFNNTDQKVANDTFSVPLTAWEDQGNYTCQAYNSDTNRAGSASVIVKLTENTPGTNNGLSGGAIAGIVIGCVAGVVLISGLVYFLCAKTSLGPGSH
ncbi:carcinoembryonic antigen-related cell adhesion molecule 5-like isoform X2 [Elgaria multicarinata webbii]|uniref:carcinoembryonic antigen-related cell adhesion molecule 5-like isoform X2 n=1 Tax=Elgaria multicarinata webbii TaxID=159646 RepID=UPI002FCCC6A9